MLKFIALALSATLALVATPAAAKDNCPRNAPISCYLNGDSGSSTNNQRSDSYQQSGSQVNSFREPNASPEQVVLALNASRIAFRNCQQDIRKDESARAWNEAGQQIGTAIADRLIRGGNSYYGGGNYRNNYNNGNNLQSCEIVRDRVYNDMLRATPAAYCDRVMMSTRRRDGTLVNGGNVDERCQSRSAEPFDAGMRYNGGN